MPNHSISHLAHKDGRHWYHGGRILRFFFNNNKKNTNKLGKHSHTIIMSEWLKFVPLILERRSNRSKLISANQLRRTTRSASIWVLLNSCGWLFKSRAHDVVLVPVPVGVGVAVGVVAVAVVGSIGADRTIEFWVFEWIECQSLKCGYNKVKYMY